jgi:hypothetical protein
VKKNIKTSENEKIELAPKDKTKYSKTDKKVS